MTTDLKKNMDPEDFGILTTSMDGIITAMNVMSDQINNHTSMVVNELKGAERKKHQIHGESR